MHSFSHGSSLLGLCPLVRRSRSEPTPAMGVMPSPKRIGDGPRKWRLGACPRIRVRNPHVLVTKQLASVEPN